MEIKYGGIDLFEEERKDAEEAVRQELSPVVLLDVLVTNPDERYDVGDFGQPDSDQAAYDEAYLSLDGTSILSRLEPPSGDSLRVAFSLHFFDPAKPLMTSYGEVEVPPIQDMPEHLQRLMPYTPVGSFFAAWLALVGTELDMEKGSCLIETRGTASIEGTVQVVLWSNTKNCCSPRGEKSAGEGLAREDGEKRPRLTS